MGTDCFLVFIMLVSHKERCVSVVWDSPVNTHNNTNVK